MVYQKQDTANSAKCPAIQEATIVVLWKSFLGWNTLHVHWSGRWALLQAFSHLQHPQYTYACNWPHTQVQKRGKRKSACLHKLLITTEFCGDHVCTCMYANWWCHKLVALMCQLALFKWVLYHAVLCLLVAGYLEIKLKNYLCLTRKHTLKQLSTNFTLIPTTAYQTFLFISNGIKLSRSCSSNIYSILNTKAEVIFMMVYAIHMNHWSY